MKPLLEVTNKEEMMTLKEQELKLAVDRFDKLKSEHADLEHKHSQLVDEKNGLIDHLHAESELCAEAEEVC